MAWRSTGRPPRIMEFADAPYYSNASHLRDGPDRRPAGRRVRARADTAGPPLVRRRGRSDRRSTHRELLRRHQGGRERGDKLAEVFNNRGVAYRLKGDHDRAIADYAQAIRINRQIRRGVHQPRRRLRPQGRLRPRHRRITIRRSSSSRRRKPISTAATPISARANTPPPSTTTIRRSSSRPISPPPSTIGAGRARWSESSSRRSPTATKRCA